MTSPELRPETSTQGEARDLPAYACVTGNDYLNALGNWARAESEAHEHKGPTRWSKLGTIPAEIPRQMMIRRPEIIRLSLTTHHLDFLVKTFVEEGLPAMTYGVKCVYFASDNKSIWFSGPKSSERLVFDDFLKEPEENKGLLSWFGGQYVKESQVKRSLSDEENAIRRRACIRYIFCALTSVRCLDLRAMDIDATIEKAIISAEQKARQSVRMTAAAVSPFIPKVKRAIVEQEPMRDIGLSLAAFQSLTELNLENVDPRSFVGWDFLSLQLVSLKVSKSNMRDLTELFRTMIAEDFVLRSEARVKEDSDNIFKVGEYRKEKDVAVPEIPHASWAQLEQLSLPFNELTFVLNPAFEPLSSVKYLDLSYNHFVSIPLAISCLEVLEVLDMSHNMIESLHGSNKALPSTLKRMNVASNRIMSVAGIDHGSHVQDIDLRDNAIQDSLEVGRLMQLRSLVNIHVTGNPFAVNEPDYRLSLFQLWINEMVHSIKSNDVEQRLHDLAIDGVKPTWMERRSIIIPDVDHEESTTKGETSDEPSVRVSSVKVRRRRVLDGVGSEHPHSETSLETAAPDLAGFRRRLETLKTQGGVDWIDDLAGREELEGNTSVDSTL